MNIEIIKYNLSKFNNNINSYNTYIIDNLIFNKNKHIVSVFKDLKIYNNFHIDYLKKFYNYSDAIQILYKIIIKNKSKFFPVFSDLKQENFILKKLKNKKGFIKNHNNNNNNFKDISINSQETLELTSIKDKTILGCKDFAEFTDLKILKQMICINKSNSNEKNNNKNYVDKKNKLKKYESKKIIKNNYITNLLDKYCKNNNNNIISFNNNDKNKNNNNINNYNIYNLNNYYTTSRRDDSKHRKHGLIYNPRHFNIDNYQNYISNNQTIIVKKENKNTTTTTNSTINNTITNTNTNININNIREKLNQKSYSIKFNKMSNNNSNKKDIKNTRNLKINNNYDDYLRKFNKTYSIEYKTIGNFSSTINNSLKKSCRKKINIIPLTTNDELFINNKKNNSPKFNNNNEQNKLYILNKMLKKIDKIKIPCYSSSISKNQSLEKTKNKNKGENYKLNSYINVNNYNINYYNYLTEKNESDNNTNNNINVKEYHSNNIDEDIYDILNEKKKNKKIYKHIYKNNLKKCKINLFNFKDKKNFYTNTNTYRNENGDFLNVLNLLKSNKKK